MAYSKQNFQNGQTLDAANLETMENGIIAGQGVKNLLINSNFKDPINSSGKTSWSASGFTIDKWRTDSAATVNLTSSGITVDATDIAGNFQQNIDNLPNGTYTFAALVNNIIRTIAFTNNNGTITTVDNSNASFGGSGSINVGKESSAYYVQINNVQGHTNTIAWTALYEGNYTVDTLPNYIPKDKHIEMSNCGIPAQPRNLLDNSDFSNPVNHRGATSYTGSGYTIDRWCTLDDEFSITIDESSISFSGGSLVQYLQKDISGIHTIAAMTNSGTLHVYTADIGEEVSYSGNLGMGRDSNGTNVVSLAPGTYVWAALYEGAYTVGTLPPYIPKDRRVEMINCGISLQPQNLLDNSDFSNPVNSRGKNTYSDEGNEYTIDKWKTGYKTNISIENGYINIFGHWRLEQYIQNPKDGIYTFAARIRINSIGRNKPVIYVDDNSGPSNDLFLDANIGEWKTYILQHDFSSTTGETITFAFSLRGGDTTASISVEWAAMYKGAYTADTLPPYVPKGKHVEMLNCGISLTPKNLLVNSDFRNPIDIDNKIGATNVNPCFTRWNFERANPSTTTQIIKTDNGIRVYKKGGEARFYQSCNYNLLGKTVSYAVGTTEGIFVGSCSVSTSSVYTQIGTHTGHLSVYQGSASEKAIFSLFFNDNTEDAIDLYWAALYEGAYTADTLPSYIPKDKHVEMLNCGIPTSPRNILKNSDFTNPLNTKGFSSISSGAYTTIDCWNSWIAGNDGKIELTSSGIKLSPPSSETIGIYQQIENYQLNKIYTVVVYINDLPYLKSFQMGNWGAGTNLGPVYFYSIPSANVLIRINSTDSEVTIQKIALYEGAYTLDTIPMYQSESKHVEMLNCGISLQPRNLLDNSDFRIKNNIINTKGLTDYSLDSGNVFDRWRLHWTGDGRVSIKDGYIELYRQTYSTYLFQHPRDLQSMVGKTYTVAAKVRYNGRIGWIDSTQRVDCGPLALDDWDIVTCTFTVGSATSDIGEAGIEIATRSNLSFEVQWVALYEGAYTKETLPTYMTKGKHVEMLNCGVPLAPYNFLDNSNFSDPVNQRGQTSYSAAAKHNIDRWETNLGNKSTITVGDGKITISKSETGGHFEQTIPVDLTGKMMTYAVKTANGITCKSAIISSSPSPAQIDGMKAYLRVYASGGKTFFQIYFNTTDSITLDLYWAALYEGSYDASTLPAYVPKDKHIEMLNCGVSLAPHNLLDNSDFTNPVNQRGKTSYSAAGYTIDRWYFYNPNGDGTVTINNGYISLTGGSGAVSLSCRFPKGFLDANKKYTSMICDNLGNINPTTLAFYDSFASFEISAGAGETKNVVWVALYEGSYDASTLPAYQPKGYAAELAECQRYYENSWFGVKKTDTQEYFAHIWSAQQADARIEFKQQKRISPTITFYPIGTESNWKIFNGSYQPIDNVENRGRGGLSGFIVRITKGSSDGTTWTIGNTIQAQGHWEASADL